MPRIAAALLLLLCTTASAATWPGEDESGGWSRTDTGVEYRDLEVGVGVAAEVGARVEVHYTGMLGDGTVFDSSIPRGSTFSFKIGEHQVIRGWEDGLVGAMPGTRRRLVIPPDQGYGTRAAGPIPPGSTLFFEVEVVAVTPPRKAPAAPPSADPASFHRTRDLAWLDQRVGNGARPFPGERVCIDYAAWVGGDRIAHTWDRDPCLWVRYQPGELPDALYLALGRMREGGVRLVRAPVSRAQGQAGLEDVEPGETVLYELHLVTALPRSP